MTGINGIYRLSDIPQTSTERFSSGFDDLDWTFGGGLPRGGITLAAGQQGVGKSRLFVSIAHRLVQAGRTVLYFNAEVGLSQFKSWLGSSFVGSQANFFVSDHRDFEDQQHAILSIEPDLIVVDSINMIEDIHRPTQLRRIMDGYKRVAEQVRSHVILVGHLDKQGAIKGSTDIPHLSDIVLMLYRGRRIREEQFEWPGGFEVEIESKNRFGVVGRKALFMHRDDGVECTSLRGMDRGLLATHDIYTAADFDKKIENGVLKPKYRSRWAKEGVDLDTSGEGMVRTVLKAFFKVK